MIPALLLFALVVASTLAWRIEKRRRRTHPVPAGLQRDRQIPHAEPFELYHNALSLCSMKTRACLAELEIPYRSHPIDLIETGRYENIRPAFLAVNRAGTVPVLVHEGHPVYESHEQIRHAARFAPVGVPSLVPEDEALRKEMEAWIDRTSLTEDPIENGEASAGNAVPGLTLPLFCAMVEKVPVRRIAEGLLFHFDRTRPVLFLLLKTCGLSNLAKLKPLVRVYRRSLRQMEEHLDALEAQLDRRGGPWVIGSRFSLADVGWLAILERLRQVDALDRLLGDGRRPLATAYWERLQERPSYASAVTGHSHPLIESGRRRIREAKARDPRLRACLE